MNIMRFTKTARLAGLALSLLVIAGLAGALTAQEKFTGKGGAKLLLTPTSTQSVAVTQPMSCPKCKDQWVARKDASARGAIKPSVLVAQHLCGGCQTTLTVAGQGKAAHQMAAHICPASTPATLACCSSPTATAAPCQNK
jgi:hypothetical protein